VVTAALALSISAQAQSPTQADQDIARIVGYSMTRGGALAFLETLTDTIGGRITGSPEDRAAAELILKTLKDAGIDSAHLEEYNLTSTWRHGRATGEVISPVKRTLIIGSYGWVPGTPGPIEVPVTDFGPIGDEPPEILRRGDTPRVTAAHANDGDRLNTGVVRAVLMFRNEIRLFICSCK